MVKKDIIEEIDLPDSYYPGRVKRQELLEPQFLLMDDFKEAKKSFEKEFIQRKLLLNNNNITKTAKTIGVGRSYLHKKIKNFK
jgi:transcriptional regulator with PAS, ATPase and Fis domain